MALHTLVFVQRAAEMQVGGVQEVLTQMGVKIVPKKSVGESMVSVEKPTGVKQEKMAKTDPVQTDGTLVHFEIGHTKNLGNYESIRFHVGVTLPASVTSIDEAYKAAKEWADKKLTQCVEEVEKEIG